MKTQLDEAKIRRLVRESITRRMLSEATGDESGYSFDPMATIQSGLSLAQGQNPNAPNASTTSEPPPPAFASGRKRGQSAAEGIAILVGGTADIDSKTLSPYVGPELGQQIKVFIDGLDYIKAPYIVTDESDVVKDWNEAVNTNAIPDLQELGPDGKPTGTKLETVSGAEGLLRYLIALKNAETGLKLTIQSFENANSDYNTYLKPLVDSFIEKINGYTTIEDLNDIAREVEKVVRSDKTENLFRSKVLLAGFSRDNSTSYELLKPVGALLFLIGAGALVYFTAGAAIAAAPSIYGIAAVTTGSATLTGVAGAFTAWSVASIASSAVAAWGLTNFAQSAIENYKDGPIGDTINAINNQPQGSEYLRELSVEISRTAFPLDSIAAYKRDQIADALSDLASLDPNKPDILIKLRS